METGNMSVNVGESQGYSLSLHFSCKMTSNFCDRPFD